MPRAIPFPRRSPAALATALTLLLLPAAAEATPPSCAIPDDFSITIEAGQTLDLPQPPCSDPEGDAIDIAVTRQPTHGSLSPSGTLPLAAPRTYTAGSSGDDEIRFRALAGGEESPEYSVAITVTPQVLIVVIPNVLFSYAGTNGPNGTVFRRLALKGVPDDATVKVRCRGATCPRARQTFRNASRTVVLRAFARHRLAPGTELETVTTAPGRVGVVKTMRIRRSKAPRISTQCMAPGETRRQRCSG